MPFSVSVKELECAPGYDSEWMISISGFKPFTITRFDTETEDKLMTAINDLPSLTPEQVRTLDKRSSVWYD